MVILAGLSSTPDHSYVPLSRPTFWAVITPIDPSTGNPVTIRLTSTNTREATGLVTGVQFDPYIEGFPARTYSIYDGEFSGGSDVEIEDLQVSANNSFGSSAFNYVWDGASCILYRGDANAISLGGGLGSVTKIFDGVIKGSPEIKESILSFNLVDKSYLLDNPLLSIEYAGTGGYEGPSGLTGILRPLTIGLVTGIVPLLIEAPYLVYEYHGYGRTGGVTGLFENAIPFGAATSTVAWAGSVAATYTALKAVTLTLGQWADAPSIGCFRLGGEPKDGGVITCDVSGQLKPDNVTVIQRADDVIAWVVARSPIGSNIDGTNFAAYYTLIGGLNLGDYFDGQETIDSVVKRWLAASGSYYFFGSNGLMSIGSVRQSGSLSLTVNTSTAGSLVEYINSLPISAPYEIIRIGGQKCFRVHDQNEISDALLSFIASTGPLFDIGLDGKLTAVEKQQVIKEDASLSTINTDIVARASNVPGAATELTNYNNAYSALTSYLSSLSPAWNDTTQTTNITRSTWNTKWSDYYSTRQLLMAQLDALAGVNISVTAIGTSAPFVFGNSLRNASGSSTYEAMVRGPYLMGACYAECDIVQGGFYTALSLDTSLTDKTAASQELHAEYIASTGALSILRNGTTILSTTIATNLTGKMGVGYDGVRYRVWVAGTEYAVSTTTYQGMIAAAAPLSHYPKWTPYSNTSVMTGIRCGPYTNNNFDQMSGSNIPEANATTGFNLLFNGDAEQGDTRGWETETLAGSAQGTFAVDTGFVQSGQYSFKMTKPLTSNKQGNNSYAIPCKPGESYVIRLWAYVGAGTGSGFKLKIYERTQYPVTGKSCNAQNATAIQTPINNVATSNGVNTWTVEYTVGASMQYFSIGLLNDNGGPVLCYYEVQVVRVINPIYDVATLGSIPPTIPNVSFTYTSTTTSITVSWAAMTIYRANGTTISISAGSQAITGLTSNTNYKIYPYAVDTGGTTATISFATGVTGSSGSPAVCYPTAGSAEAAAVMYQRGNIPLYTISATTPSAGTGGGGGGGYGCLHPSTIIETARGWIRAGDLRIDDLVDSPSGFVGLSRLERRDTGDWIKIRTQSGYVTVTPDHRLHLMTGAEIRAHDLRLGHWLQGKEGPQRVISLELIEEVEGLVQLELEEPHLYYLGTAGLLCHNPKP